MDLALGNQLISDPSNAKDYIIEKFDEFPFIEVVGCKTDLHVVILSDCLKDYMVEKEKGIAFGPIVENKYVTLGYVDLTFETLLRFKLVKNFGLRVHYDRDTIEDVGIRLIETYILE